MPRRLGARRKSDLGNSDESTVTEALRYAINPAKARLSQIEERKPIPPLSAILLPFYSYRRAIIGSIFIARLAGT
jgi:hypothetical protein